MVLNAGVEGFSVGQAYAYLKNYLLPEFNPDLIIWNLHGSDLTEMEKRSLFIIDRDNNLQYIPSYLHGLYIEGMLRNKIGFLAQRSHLVQLLLNMLQNVDPVSLIKPASEELNFNKIEKMITDIGDNANLIVTTTPSYSFLVSGEPSDEELWIDQMATNNAIHHDGLIHLNTEIQKGKLDSISPEYCYSDDYSALFLTKEQDSGEGIWRHLSENGNGAYAKILFAYLTENNVLP